jgi:hypothetical protein
MDRSRPTATRKGPTPAPDEQRDRQTAGHAGVDQAGRPSPATSDPVAWLQRTAGNRAVTELLTSPGTVRGALAQRDTPPGPTIPERIAAAEKSLKDGLLADPIWSIFRDNGGTADGIADRLWREKLALGDVLPPFRSRTDPAAKLRAGLVAAVNKVVAAKLQEMIVKVRSKDEAARIKEQVTRLTGLGTAWDAPDVANQLWREWVGPGSIVNGSAGSGTPKQLYDALKGAAAQHVPALRATAFDAAGVKALDAAEVSAVETLLKPRAQWVRDEAGFAALTDELHKSRGGNGRHDDPGWQQLNGRVPKLVVVAEANIVNAMKIANRAVTPDTWAEFRGRFIATISKTIWRYHEDNIVDASVFGTAVKKSVIGQGLHRDVAQAFRLVEQSALRLSGKTSIAELRSAEGSKGKDAGTKRNPITLPGTEFRFEPVSHEGWMRENAKLSPHGTGRAIDFREATNPAVAGAAYEVIHLLSSPIGDAFGQDRTTIDWVKLRQQAGALAPLIHQRAKLEEDLKVESDPVAQSVLQQEIVRVNDLLNKQVVDSAAAKGLRKDAEAALDRLAKIETAFQAAWQPNAAKTDDKELLAALLAQADAAKAAAQTKLTALLDSEAKARAAKEAAAKAAAPTPPGTTPTPGGTGAPTPAPTTPAPKVGAKPPKPPAPPPKSAEALALEASIARIDRLRPLLTLNATSKTVSGSQKEMLKSLRSRGEHGLTDMPLWLVQAFIEQGWTWGGSWGGFLDAMHFDYLGPVADVIGS